MRRAWPAAGQAVVGSGWEWRGNLAGWAFLVLSSLSVSRVSSVIVFFSICLLPALRRRRRDSGTILCACAFSACLCLSLSSSHLYHFVCLYLPVGLGGSRVTCLLHTLSLSSPPYHHPFPTIYIKIKNKSLKFIGEFFILVGRQWR